jgi:sarcosine oxidase subunit beta
VQKNYDAVGVTYEEWSVEKVKEMVPVYDLHENWPVRRPEDPEFFDEPDKMLEGALFCPEGGYMSDPALSSHNIMRATEAKGGEFMFNAEVVEVRSKENQVLGVTLKDGTRIDAPVVVNAAGPHSYKINQWPKGFTKGATSKPRPCGTR